MKVASFIFGFFVMAIIVLGFMNFAGDAADNLSVELETETYESVFDKTQDIGDTFNESWNTINEDEQSKTAQFFTGVNLAFTIVKNVGSLAMTLPVLMIGFIAEVLFLPTWFVGILFSLITFLLVIAIVASILGRKP
jgi:hypothetical protein